MKNTFLTMLLMGSSVAFSATIIEIDFGASQAAPANYNVIGAADVGSTVSLIDFSTGVASGASLVFTETGPGGPADNLLFLDGSAFGGSAVEAVYTDGLIAAGPDADELNFTLSGLDPNATYDLFFGGLTPGNDFGAEVTIDGLVQTTAVLGTQDVNPFLSFSGLAPNALGTLVIDLDDINEGNTSDPSRNVGLSQLTITEVVPEPSSAALLGLAGLALVSRRKRA